MTFTRVDYGGLLYDAGHGSPGWAIAGLTDPSAPKTAVLYSAAGDQWQQATVKGGGFDITRVAWGNGSYIGVGTRCVAEGQHCRFDAVTWRSTDGRTWRPLGGTIRDVGYIAGPLAVGSAGTLVLGWVSAHRRNGVYWSMDGTAWARVEPTEFGADAAFLGREAVVAARGGFVLMAEGCDGCRTRVYESTRGRNWRQIGELGPTDINAVSLATDGNRLVAAVLPCGGGDCRTEVWASVDGTAWTRTLALPLSSPLVTFAGTAFVLVGTGGPGLGHISTWISTDGDSWSELAADFGGDPPFGADGRAPCDMEFLAGGSSDVVMGAEVCGAWRGVLP